jgi:trans-aconitate methyltransferase
MNRQQTASDFTKAFSNNVARDFVQKTMIDHYSEAIMFHHPQKEKLNEINIKNKVTLLVNYIFGEILTIYNNPTQLYELLLKLGRKQSTRCNLWFTEFDEAYDYYKQNSKLPFIGSFLLPSLSGYQTVIDFGCGDGEIDSYVRKQLGLSQISGVDILDWRTDTNKTDPAFKFYRQDFSDPKDVLEIPLHEAGIMHAMLHHVSRDPNEIVEYLQRAKHVLSKKLLVVEDVLYSPDDMQATIPGIESLRNAAESQPHFAEFLTLTVEEQRSIITILDLLSNSLAMGVPEMNFPFGAQQLLTWVDIFANAGLTLKEVQVLGFQNHLFHKMSQCLFVLEV